MDEEGQAMLPLLFASGLSLLNLKVVKVDNIIHTTINSRDDLLARLQTISISSATHRMMQQFL